MLALETGLRAQYTCVTNAGTLTITGYTGPGGLVAIPSVIDGLPVTGIGSNAFAGSVGLTNVVVPGSVTRIGDYAFSGCYGLTSINLPGSVTSIGAWAFELCTSLSHITIPASVTSLGHMAFYACTGLTKITVPGSVTNLDAFGDCTALTAVTLANGVISIADSAFYGCTNLTSVTIPSSVRSIGTFAFYSCGLTRVIIPKGVTSIGDGAFCGCTDLKEILVDLMNPSYASLDGVLFDTRLGTLLTYPAKRSGSYTIPSSVRRIGVAAFANCCGLTSVSIPNGVSTIPNWAFYECVSLNNVIIPASVTSLGREAFFHCTSLTRVRLPEHLADIGEGAFQECFALKAIYFMGDAPQLGGLYDLGWYGQATTVYYLPGHTGWGTTLGCFPAVQWNGYAPAGATYHGLFYVGSNVLWISAGAFDMRVTANGKFSGRLLLSGERYSLSGAMGPFGQASVTISRRNVSAVQVQFLMAGPDQLTGSVRDGNWTAELTAERTAFDGRLRLAPQMGRYTMVIPGADPLCTTVPNGYGYGTLLVDNSGQVHLSGALADNTKITQAAPLSRDGVWPVYVSLYRGRSLLLGWLTFTNMLGADLSGLLQWNRPTDADAPFYPGGFQADTSVQGWRYTRPKDGARVLPFSKVCLVLGGAGLQQDLTNHVVLQANNRVTSTNKATLTFTLSTGAFRGTVPNPAHPGTKRIPFSGVLVQNQSIENSWPLGYGCGWFMGTNQCGSIHLYDDEAN
jgi:hypothetical protein